MSFLTSRGTRLIENARDGNLDKVRGLLRRGANVNAKDEFGYTALAWACYSGHLEVVKALLNHEGVDVNVKDKNGWTALISASHNGKVDVVRILLNHKGLDLNIKDRYGRTALDAARDRGNNDVAHLLDERMKLENPRHEEEQKRREQEREQARRQKKGSELILKARDGNLFMVLKLLSTGANVNAKGAYGNTALICASYNGHLKVVCALLKHNGVDVNIQAYEGETALFWASEKGHVEVVHALLNQNGVDVNIKKRYGETALFTAIKNRHLEVVRALLNHKGVDVNITDMSAHTALDVARTYSRIYRNDDVLRLLKDRMERDKPRDEKKQKRLEEEVQKRLEEEVQKRLEEEELKRREKKEQKRREREEQTRLAEEERNRHIDLELKQSMEEKDPRQELIVKQSEGSVTKHRVTGNLPRQNKNIPPPSDDTKIEHARSNLLQVMNATTAEPVELSLQYIVPCLTSHKLGSGAFGDVFLAEDSRLQKKFAVKMISPTYFNEDAIQEIRKSFQTELSTLKRFRHPNIIVLYGYSLNANSSLQCLVYEYAANGSLADFFADDCNRARLPADIRLSIMYQLTRAVHFLHTGGCKVAGKGWKVFHRDIKSANICLADDFTPRLIDCGLAKFVSDDNSRATPGSVTWSLRSTTGGPAFGTPGYMCPEYVMKKGRGAPCPYIAAYDVYSIGVVLVELILGCPTGGRSTQNGTRFLDVFGIYVKDDRDRRIVDGWAKLKGDADSTIIWNPASLELVCKAAIQCMAPFPEERLSTKELLDKLIDAILLNTNAGNQRPEAESAAGSGMKCHFCNDVRTDVKCSEGHALCSACIVVELGDDCGCQLLCPIKGCSSQPFHDDDLYGRIPVETYRRYVESRAERKVWDKCFLRFESQFAGVQSQLSGLKFDVHGIKVDVQKVAEGVDDVQMGVNENNSQLQKQQQVLQGMARGMDRSLAALAMLSADQFKECPNLVWVTPMSVEKKDLQNPKKWFTKKYSVVFICAHSGEPGHEPFEIEMPRKWIGKIAPWLKLCLQVLTTFANSQCLPFPIPDLPFFHQCEMMNSFLDSFVDEASNAVVAQLGALLENGSMSIDTYGQLQTLAGDAFKFIAEKARKEKRSQWMPPQMVPVLDKNGTPIWVKGKHAKRVCCA